MISVRVDINVRDTMRALDGVEKQQFPFAYASALTRTAIRCSMAVKKQTRKQFKLHSEFIPRGVLIQPAKKNEIKQFGSSEAAVYTSRKITPFMARHETGGVRTPQGSVLAIPGIGLQSMPEGKWRTKRGRVKMKYQPKRLLSGTNRKGARSKKSLSKKAFVIPGRGSRVPLLMQRVSSGAGHKGRRDPGLKLLYVFDNEATIKSTWGFEETVRRVVPKVWPRIFAAEFRKAIQTAR